MVSRGIWVGLNRNAFQRLWENRTSTRLNWQYRRDVSEERDNQLGGSPRLCQASCDQWSRAAPRSAWILTIFWAFPLHDVHCYEQGQKCRFFSLHALIKQSNNSSKLGQTVRRRCINQWFIVVTWSCEVAGLHGMASVLWDGSSKRLGRIPWPKYLKLSVNNLPFFNLGVSPALCNRKRTLRTWAMCCCGVLLNTTITSR